MQLEKIQKQNCQYMDLKCMVSIEKTKMEITKMDSMSNTDLIPRPSQGGGKTYLGRGWTSEGSEKKTPPSFDHTIEEEDFKHRPSPGITSITSEDKELGRNFRETTC